MNIIQEKMSFLRGSINYVWSTTSVLGKGATGAVYQGVNKANGDPVAVKTFNQISHLRPQEVQMREFEVLQKVNHENIVKLLAIEEEQENRGKVIVMELCTGGSLFNILDDPENTYGLPEGEFLTVLDHLTAGMKHLFDNNIVHRDLKPGNIMKFISDDGRIIYKLTDFGAARELQEGQQFQSLYGTEEYLHPDLYERAVLRKPVNKTFAATIDLWSIGVTLYHVATGNLPFRPYGGRKNKETMYYITTKKVSGVISGIQVTEDGQIEWRKTLPDSCQLSQGLRMIVTPLLAGLLEADSRKIWTFDKFFAEVTDMLSRKLLNVFYVNKAQLIKVYIHPDENYENLQNYVKNLSTVSEENQLLLYKSELFCKKINEGDRAGGYPETNEEEPIFLFNTDDNNVGVVQEPAVPDFKDFASVISVESDASQAKTACSIGYLCKRRIEKAATCCRLFNRSVETLIANTIGELVGLNRDVVFLVEKTATLRKTLQLLRRAHQLCPYEVEVANFVGRLEELSEKFIQEGAKGVAQLHETYVVHEGLAREWSGCRPAREPAGSRAPERARTEVEKLRDSWQHLVRDRATRSLSYNDEQFHILERIKIAHTIGRLKELLLKEVAVQYEQMGEVLGDWYKKAQTVYLPTMILQRDVAVYGEQLREFELELVIEYGRYFEEVNRLVANASNESMKKTKNSHNQKLRGMFNEHKRNNSDVNKLLEDNYLIIQRFEQILSEIC